MTSSGLNFRKKKFTLTFKVKQVAIFIFPYQIFFMKSISGKKEIKQMIVRTLIKSNSRIFWWQRCQDFFDALGYTVQKIGPHLQVSKPICEFLLR